ncbi:MAG: hypothetical protein KA604_01490 [Candidatus Saccharimonas sp.]|nr:hypothetical protein [Candidatus Saccharimonas sp.]
MSNILRTIREKAPAATLAVALGLGASACSSGEKVTPTAPASETAKPSPTPEISNDAKSPRYDKYLSSLSPELAAFQKHLDSLPSGLGYEELINQLRIPAKLVTKKGSGKLEDVDPDALGQAVSMLFATGVTLPSDAIPQKTDALTDDFLQKHLPVRYNAYHSAIYPKKLENTPFNREQLTNAYGYPFFQTYVAGKIASGETGLETFKFMTQVDGGSVAQRRDGLTVSFKSTTSTTLKGMETFCQDSGATAQGCAMVVTPYYDTISLVGVEIVDGNIIFNEIVDNN